MRVLVVDDANVVGSRPAGGAAERRHQAIAAADQSYDVAVLVLKETPSAASRLVRTARSTRCTLRALQRRRELLTRTS